MLDAMKRSAPAMGDIREDASRLLKLQDNAGENIVGNIDQASQITDIFKKFRR
jgi:hypothetical protein